MEKPGLEPVLNGDAVIAGIRLTSCAVLLAPRQGSAPVPWFLRTHSTVSEMERESYMALRGLCGEEGSSEVRGGSRGQAK